MCLRCLLLCMGGAGSAFADSNIFNYTIKNVMKTSICATVPMGTAASVLATDAGTANRRHHPWLTPRMRALVSRQKRRTLAERRPTSRVCRPRTRCSPRAVTTLWKRCDAVRPMPVLRRPVDARRAATSPSPHLCRHRRRPPKVIVPAGNDGCALRRIGGAHHHRAATVLWSPPPNISFHARCPSTSNESCPDCSSKSTLLVVHAGAPQHCCRTLLRGLTGETGHGHSAGKLDDPTRTFTEPTVTVKPASCDPSVQRGCRLLPDSGAGK